ncbi:hypothetical protein [Streptomyces venezuelae]|uniref:hypothetical protein n=1 Tax=Streptomyces venezuelae TaxID=54571 RepID=UPI003433B501
MRSDHRAQFVATRPYTDRRALERALYEHNRRVAHARREDPEGELARQPRLTVSGSTVFSAETAACGKCQHLVPFTFGATSQTHRIVNRSGESTRRTAWLCVQCWSATVLDDDDPADLPLAAVRWC